MCIDLVLGSVGPLSVSRYAPPREDPEDGQIMVFTIERTKSRDEQAIFPTRHLYYIRTTHTGDACGFCGSYLEAETARHELATFLDHALKFVADLQLYVAYHDFGNSGVIPSKFDELGPSDIRTWVTGFQAGDFFKVIRED